MNANELKVGQAVKVNGFEGSIVKVCDGQLTGMIEVRLPGGVCCVDAADVTGIDPHAGPKYQTGRDTAAIAKLFRADVKAAIAAGELPEGLKLSVRVKRFSGGSSIDVNVTACPGVDVVNPAFVVSREAIPNRFIENMWNYSKACKSLLAQLEMMLEAYNRCESDLQADYYNTKFYAHVGVDSDFLRGEQAKVKDAAAELIADLKVATACGKVEDVIRAVMSVAA